MNAEPMLSDQPHAATANALTDFNFGLDLSET
jgi:hypothetical protein